MCGTIGAGTPPSTPPPAGWGQDVDVQITIASGLAGQTAPQTVDVGTVTGDRRSEQPRQLRAGFTELTKCSRKRQRGVEAFDEALQTVTA